MYSSQDNQLILDKWAERAHTRNEGEISPDGVYYKGERHQYESDGKIYCEREPGNEDALWNSAKRRILFISKAPTNLTTLMICVVVNLRIIPMVHCHSKDVL